MKEARSALRVVGGTLRPLFSSCSMPVGCTQATTDWCMSCACVGCVSEGVVEEARACQGKLDKKGGLPRETAGVLLWATQGGCFCSKHCLREQSKDRAGEAGVATEADLSKHKP